MLVNYSDPHTHDLSDALFSEDIENIASCYFPFRLVCSNYNW